MTQDVFTALADPTRRALLGELSSGERAVGELVAAVAASQPTVSKHLRVLRESGLVQQRAVGQKRFYSIEAPVLLDAAETLRGLAGESSSSPEPEPAAAAPEPESTQEPTRTAPVVVPVPEPVASPEPVIAPEPVVSPEPVVLPGPAAVAEPAAIFEPAAADRKRVV